MIKAIRLVNGFNPDLRVKLSVNKSDLYDWIDKNRFGIFGIEFGLSKPAATSDDWEKYERAIWSAVNQVLSGQAND